MNLEVLSSLENAIEFYYEYLKENYEGSAFIQFKKLLCILALSQCPLNAKQINDEFKIDIATYIEKNDSFRIFIRSSFEDSEEYYTLGHEKICELILKDNLSIANDLMREVYNHILMVLSSSTDFDNILREQFAPFKFISHLFSGNFISFQEKLELINKIIALPFKIEWTGDASLINKEIELLIATLSFLRKIYRDEEKYSLEYARLNGVLGMDYFKSSLFYESEQYLSISKSEFEKYCIENLSEKYQYDYAQLLNVYGTYKVHTKQGREALDYYLIALPIYKRLSDCHAIPSPVYFKNLVCLGNVYHDNNLLREQKKCLDQANALITKYQGDKIADAEGFMMQSYHSYYLANKKYKKSLYFINKSQEIYQQSIAKNEQLIYIGDYIAGCYFKIEVLLLLYKNKVEACIAEIENEFHKVEEVQIASGYKNHSIQFNLYYHLGHAYALAHNAKKAKEYYTLAQLLLENNSRDLNAVSAFNHQKHLEQLAEEIKKISQ